MKIKIGRVNHFEFLKLEPLKILKIIKRILFGSSDFSSDQKQIQVENKRLEKELKKLEELEQQLLTENKNV
ncbi:hypothetical protein [Winogradskyella sp. 3972H.M.0a.05]|uniref:hypothetical protein n=1 Tax=Winogradskyella sp. 3972H.M.0a.05 TaxID=2950277 RepID=UPI003391319E